MKSSILCFVFSFGLVISMTNNCFAQNNTIDSVSRIVSWPSAFLIGLSDSSTGVVVGISGTGSLRSMHSTVGSLALKGVNAQKRLHEEAQEALYKSFNSKEVNLGEYKALNSMIEELEQNADSFDEINRYAEDLKVSFNEAALLSIFKLTE